MNENYNKCDFIKEISKFINGLDGMLNQGVDITEIDKIESVIGTSLPQEFKNLYMLYNGEIEEKIFGVMAGMRWMDTSSILEEIEEIKELYIKIDDDNLALIKGGKFIKEWVPFAEDFQGRYLALDLNPNVRGSYGQVIVINTHMNKAFVMAESFDDFLDMIVEKLEIGMLEVKEIGAQKVISWKNGNAYVCGYELSRKKQGLKINLDAVWSEILSREAKDNQISLETLSNIRNLNIARGLFGQVKTVSLDILRYMTNLRGIKIHAREINDFSVIAGLYNLNEIHIAGCDITESKMEDLKRIRCLTELSLENLSMRDAIGFTELKRLQKLRLCNVNIEDAKSIAILEQMDNLKTLELENMMIYDMEIIKKLAITMSVNLKFIR